MKYFLYCLAACMFIVIIWALCIKRTNGAKFSLAVQIPSLYMTIIFLSLVIAVNLNINNSTKLKRVEKVADTKEVIALNLVIQRKEHFSSEAVQSEMNPIMFFTRKIMMTILICKMFVLMR